MLGAVVRAPQSCLAAGLGKRQIGTTAPKSLRGGKAVDGRPQWRPCPGCAGAVRAGSGGGSRSGVGAVPAPECAPQLGVAPGCSRCLPFAEASWSGVALLLGPGCGRQCALAAATHSLLNFKQRRDGRNAEMNGRNAPPGLLTFPVLGMLCLTELN